MHRLLYAFAIAIRDHWCVYVQYVQSMWVFGPCLWVRVCGLEAMESSSTELTGGRRDLGRGAKEAKETRVCMHTHTHTSSSGLGGHLLWSGSLAASARSGSKVSPRQLHRIIPFHLMPSTNCVRRDWPVPPGALRRRLRRCLLTLCVSYGSESVGGERVAH